jgi:benzoyl-CoA reductase/2-hydroxyglutaryl-CoA dehydratase subunit BcrC/BadD/HgdB
MTTVAYCSPFVPPEWILAHGFVPERIVPSIGAGPSELAGMQGLCPYAGAFAENLMRRKDRAVVAASTCDQMRRVAQLLQARGGFPVFVLNVPASWQTVNAHRMYRSELERLGRFLVRLGGTPPASAELADLLLEHDARRSLDAGRQRVQAGRVPLALLGSPLCKEQLRIEEIIEEAGGTVVLDGTDGGDRTMPGRLDRRAVRGDPLSALADAYFGALPDAFRRPNYPLYAWLAAETRARGVRGVVFAWQTWCDVWHAELPRLVEWSRVPVLGLQLAGTGDDGARSRARIEAFLEVLR